MSELIQVNTGKYRGEWIAMVKDKVIAHNKDLRLIETEIKNCKDVVTIAKIPRANVLLY